MTLQGLPTVIGNAISNPWPLCSLSIACPAVENTQFGAINTLSPKVTLALLRFPCHSFKLWTR